MFVSAIALISQKGYDSSFPISLYIIYTKKELRIASGKPFKNALQLTFMSSRLHVYSKQTRKCNASNFHIKKKIVQRMSSNV